jgi:hypothetical protein
MTFQVHSVRVSFTREKQPKDYEKSVPSVEFSASVEDGTDHNLVARQLMADACTTVYNTLGIDVPTAVADKLGGTATVNVELSTTTTAEGFEKSQEQVKGRTEEEATTKRKRRTKAEMEADAAKEKAESTSGVPDTDDDIPGVDTTPDVPDTEDTAEVPDTDDDIPGNDAKSDTMSAEDLQAFITDVVASKKLSPKAVKEVLASFGASRTSEVDAANRAKVKQQIEASI